MLPVTASQRRLDDLVDMCSTPQPPPRAGEVGGRFDQFLGTPFTSLMVGKTCQGGARLICQRHQQLNVPARGSVGGADDKGALDPFLVLERERPTPRAPGYRQRTAAAGFGYQLIEVVAFALLAVREPLPYLVDEVVRRFSATRPEPKHRGPAVVEDAPRVEPLESKGGQGGDLRGCRSGAPRRGSHDAAPGRTYRFPRNRGSLSAALAPPFDRYRDEPQPLHALPTRGMLCQTARRKVAIAGDSAQMRGAHATGMCRP